MSKRRFAILILSAAFAALILFQFQTIARLHRELSAAIEENTRLRPDLIAQQRDSSSPSAGVASRANDLSSETEQKHVQELESEVLRLRGVANRAVRAEAEVAQLKSALQSHSTPTSGTVPDANPGSNSLLAYFEAQLGGPVAPPGNLDPAYTKEGLLTAIQQAAQLAGVSVKKVEIETSEFPFLAGVVCESEEDFEKMKIQFNNMPAYQYGGATSSRGTYAFNITPYRSYPPETAQQISRRTNLRMQMFFEHLSTP